MQFELVGWLVVDIAEVKAFELKSTHNVPAVDW